MTLPEPSPDAASNGAVPRDLEAVAELLSRRGLVGIVWLDEALITRSRFGTIAEFVALGQPVGEAILPLYGLDETIKSLRRRPDASLDYPNVSIVSADGATPKLDISVFWLNPQQSYLVLLALVRSQSDIEFELNNQARARLIAEAKIVAQAKEIARANRDLAEFAYIISHDLQAPMRALRYVIDDLEAALAVTPPQAGQQETQTLMAEVRQHARRMSSMMTELLSYSRIGRKESATEPVNLAPMIASIVGSMPRRAGLLIKVTGEWPQVITLRAPLDLVLRNLIDNAIKHHDRTIGQIEVAARQAGSDTIEITVSDDGPGIAREHQAAVFQPFVRLKPEAEAAGSGIGLSMVRKTVETAGGSLELHSDPAVRRGTVFTVRWPLTK